nr:MAG TPA: hypothetical protein [Caudoviricetes sp.]
MLNLSRRVGAFAPPTTVCNSYLNKSWSITAISAMIADITVALGCVNQGSFFFCLRFSILSFLSFVLVNSLTLTILYPFNWILSIVFFIFFKIIFISYKKLI